jgi:molecular chaperone DnaK (HSP70)
MAEKVIGIDLGTTNSVVSVLEGGYSLTALRECSVAHLRGLTAA